MAEVAKRPAGIKTREAILEAARHLFLRQGYHATGMRQIAHESGISLGAVYNHFPSKEEILQEILAQRNIYRVMAEALSRARGDSAARLLEDGFRETMAALQGKEDFAFLLFIDILEFQGVHVAKLGAEAIPHFLSFFQRVFLIGGGRGELREVSPVLVGRAYLGMIFSSFIIENVLGILGRGEVKLPLRVENWEQGMVDLLLHGVLKEPCQEEGE